jgi:hypothetical protein
MTMKKILTLLTLALMLTVVSCDIDSPRPNTGAVDIYLCDIPDDVKAVSIWCTVNEWKADNVNGSSQYIAEVAYDENIGSNVAVFKLTDYPLSVPLQFQFTPMPTKDTKRGDDWWSYAISGSGTYDNDKNNMTCDFTSKGGYDGCKIIVSKETYGSSYWDGSFPVYGISPTRWFNPSWKSCFKVE